MNTKHYYRCGALSASGRRLADFSARAHKAALAAEEYAKAHGAVAYVQPVEFCEGGVEYLEFNADPDPKVWRKRVFGAHALYEPECFVRSGLVALARGCTPEADWRRDYSPDGLSWSQVRGSRPLADFAALIGYRPAGVHADDWLAVERALADKVFFAFAEFYGKQPEPCLRRAVEAEKQRRALPVVGFDDLFDALGIAADRYRADVAPAFFLAGDAFFIEAASECDGPDFIPVSKAEFDAASSLLRRDGGAP